VSSRGPAERVLVLAPTLEAGSRVLRRAVEGAGAAFGWQRSTLRELGARLASAGLAESGRAPVSQLVLDAVCARTVHHLREEGALGRYTEVGDRPGLPRALARTFTELGLAGVEPSAAGLESSLASCFGAYRFELADAGLADPSDVLRAAIARARDPSPHPLLDAPLVLLDPAMQSALEAELVAALAARAPVTAIVPTGDHRALRRLREALGVDVDPLGPIEEERGSALDRLRTNLFADRIEGGAPVDDSVELFSAPGENRECVEIARRALAAAESGVPFDRMAVLAHAPGRYRAHLVEALRRAQIPAYFSHGTVEPDPSGRALLALLACRERKLSARAFAEYLSLGAVPDPDDDGAPPSADREVAWLEDEDGDAAEPADEAPVDADDAVVRGTLRAPWRWERLLVEAAVIDADRWRRRLAALEHRLAARRDALELDDPIRERVERDQRDLSHLAAYALPLIDELAALPERATWGEWADHLERLARRAIRHPERVLAVLRELSPMAPIGPVGVAEVQLVLGRRLAEMRSAPPSAPAGRLFVGSTAEARGLSFDVVFAPGLVERVFPRKVAEDPICLDAARVAISDALATTDERVALERLALRLVAGAAERRLVLSYPRVDSDRGRARVPSFYALEVLRAIEGSLPSFGELGRRAEAAGAARMAWPAPRRPEDAIDGAEYDLAVLDDLLHGSTPTPGGARYLLDANPHLARALRARFARWQQPKWTRHDGLSNPSPAAQAALARHKPDARPHSATALEQLAVCPYRFYLRAVLRLEPHQTPEALEELDPLTRGRLIHEAQHQVLRALLERGAVPVTEERLDEAFDVLDQAMEEVGARFREQYAPAIDRVFRDALADTRADLAEWLVRMTESPEWVPVATELAFGLPEDDTPRDPASTSEPVALTDEGLVLRGAIDLVEARGDELRATDHKSGAVPDFDGPITDGGRSLQPVLYARALEALRPDAKVVGGRLYYCTSRGQFAARPVVLTHTARDAVRTVAETLGKSIDKGFLPAWPDAGACDRCDYRRVCGPAEPRRVRKKHKNMVGPFLKLRKLP